MSDGGGVPRLVEQDLHVAGEDHRGDDPEPLLLGSPSNAHALGLDVGHRRT